MNEIRYRVKRWLFGPPAWSTFTPDERRRLRELTDLLRELTDLLRQTPLASRFVDANPDTVHESEPYEPVAAVKCVHGQTHPHVFGDNYTPCLGPISDLPGLRVRASGSGGLA